jgi:tRNA threonylcarbamoyladenosine biosynthesis protein TsaE
MNLPFKYLSKSSAETEQKAEEFASIVSCGDFILLKGRLGAGKTKFVSGLAKYFCYAKNTNIVTSPTFSLMNRYFCAQAQHNKEIIIDHFDFYRLKNLYDLENSGFFDSLSSNDTLTIAEWGDKIGFDYTNIIKNYYFEVNITADDADGESTTDNLCREIIIEKIIINNNK